MREIGLFKHGEGAIVKKIECSTSNIFKSSVILGVCVVALGIVATWYLQRRKSPPAAAPSGLMPCGIACQTRPVFGVGGWQALCTRGWGW
eukprot:g11238.t1